MSEVDVSGFELTFQVFGEEQVGGKLNGISWRVEDIRPALEVLGDRFADLERRQFESEGSDSLGSGWDPLSPKYGAWKATHYPGAPIMVRTGDLKESLTQRPFGVDEVAMTEAAFGTGVEYGQYHQQGAGHLPPRRLVDLPEPERRAWVKTVLTFLMEGTT